MSSYITIIKLFPQGKYFRTKFEIKIKLIKEVVEAYCGSQQFFVIINLQLPRLLNLGSDACDVLLELEKEYDVKFMIDEDSVYVESWKDQKINLIRDALSDAWKKENFLRLSSFLFLAVR